MYHPNTMLKIAHEREEYLVREAQLCGIPKAGHPHRPLPVRAATIVLIVTMLLALAKVLIA
jgi:hypothetical protein